MPPKPITQMTEQDFFNQYQTGANAQKTVLDKLWYNIVHGAYVTSYGDAHFYSKDVTRELDDPPTNPVELEKAKDEYRKSDPDRYYSNEEINNLTIPLDETANQNLSNAHSQAEEAAVNDLFPLNTYEDVMNGYKLLGMIQGKVAMEIGKEYEEKLNSLPENEPDREEKAINLQRSDLESKANTLLISYNNFESLLTDKLRKAVSGSQAIMQQTPAGSIEKMMATTVEDFYNSVLGDPAAVDATIAKDRANGYQYNRYSTFYDYYKETLQKEEQAKKERNPNYEIKPVSDKDILLKGQGYLEKQITKGGNAFGNKIIRSTLSEQDKNKFDVGMKIMTTINYKAPDQVKEFENQVSKKQYFKNRIKNANDRFAYYQQEANRNTSLNMEQDPVFSKAFGNDLTQNISEHDKFIHKHLNANALLGSPEERRNHLALVMAANTLGADNPGPLNTRAIDAAAKKVLKLKAFQKLSDFDVSEALLTPEAARKAQVKIVKETFDVPQNERADYISKMKQLSETMVPGSGQSAKYQTMFNAVNAIGKLDPADPQIEEKLIAANSTLLSSVTDYTKGKKSIRSFTSSQKRFDNSIDVLAVANEHVPGLKPYAKEIVDRTNTVRKARPESKSYVDLSQYGTQRARANAPVNAGIHAVKDIEGPKPPKIGL